MNNDKSNNWIVNDLIVDTEFRADVASSKDLHRFSGLLL